jgi:hypothetical protein
MGSTGAPPAAWQGPGIEEVQTAANPLISGRCVFRRPEPALIHENVSAVLAAVKQVGTQRGCTTEVMRDNDRLIKFPVRQHVGKHLTLNIK